MDGSLSQADQTFWALRGDFLRERYVDNVRQWFGCWLRPVERVTVDDLALLDDAVSTGRLTAREVDDLRDVDVLVRGRARPGSPFAEGEVILAVEVSAVIDGGDIERAIRRASVLARAGYSSAAVCGGIEVASDVDADAVAAKVILDLKRG